VRLRQRGLPPSPAEAVAALPDHRALLPEFERIYDERYANRYGRGARSSATRYEISSDGRESAAERLAAEGRRAAPRRRKIDRELVDQMRAWQHSGFSVDNSVYLPAGETSGLKRLGQYILRCPFSLARAVRLTDNGSVIYRAEQKHSRRFPRSPHSC
jgi:hypothetical protein